MSDYTLANGTANVDALLATNAYVIGESIYDRALNVSNWNAVIQKTALPTGVGEKLTSLIYDASIPTTSAGGSTLGVNWTTVGADFLSATSTNTESEGQVIAASAQETLGAQDGMSYVKFTKRLREYGLSLTRIQSPWFTTDSLRTAAAITKQIGAITKAMTTSVRWAWERRYETEYEKNAANLVTCLTSSTAITDKVDSDDDGSIDDLFYGVNLAGLHTVGHATGINVIPTANISNKILDRIYTRLKIVTPPEDAYGMANGQPVFCLMISDEASRTLMTESGIRDDVRKSSMVDELLKPLGVNESFRGFFHMTNPAMPRFTITLNTLVRVEPLDETGHYNADYDAADYEVAYVVHKDVIESQVPAPTVMAPGMAFNPVRYTGEFVWLNTKDNSVNLLGDRGFFLATLGSAIKPKNVDYGYVILFKRTSTTPAA